MSPTGKSISVLVRVVRASGRGEAVWASERRFDPVARAVGRAIYILQSGLKTMPGGCPRKMMFFMQVL